MHVVGCVCAWNFGTKFFFSGGENVKPRRKSNFLKKGKNRNISKNLKFF